MLRGIKRQDSPSFTAIPPQIFPSGNEADASPSVTFASSSEPLPSSTSSSSPTPTSTPTETAPSSQTSSPPPNNGTPLSTLIPAIVVPILVVALVAPVVLYFCLTRHDRQRSKSRMSSRVSSRAYVESRAEVKSPHFRQDSSETQHSKASEIMNFDLGPAVEKPLPVVNVTRAPANAYERSRTPVRPDTFEEHSGLDSSIGQAISRYSLGRDSWSNPVDAPSHRPSVQELTEENMRIARLANDSRASFGRREQDEVSSLSASDERDSRNIGARGVDELSAVSSMHEDDRRASSDRGGGIFGNHQARRSGPFR